MCWASRLALPITFVRTETLPNEKNLNLAGINVDFDYLKTVNIRLVLGRDFNPGQPTDSTEAIIINRVAAKELHLGNNPIDKIIEVGSGPAYGGLPHGESFFA